MNARGQTLALFSLTMLLLCLMVLLTLSLGARVRSRMDLQTVADASAYSNAVATARTFNALAVMNRVQVAHTVSTIATLSLLSWATRYWAHADTARRLLLQQMVFFAEGSAVHCGAVPSTACTACNDGVLRTGGASLLMMLWANHVERRLERDAQVFAAETDPRWQASLALYGGQQRLHAALLQKLADTSSSFAARMVADGNLARSAPLSTAVNARELGAAIGPDATMHGDQPAHVGRMVMGTRGNRFITERKPRETAWGHSFLRWSFAAGPIRIHGDGNGRGYLADRWVDPSSRRTPATYGHPYGPYANDEGDKTGDALFFNWPECTVFGYLAFDLGRDGIDTTEAQVNAWRHTHLHAQQHAYQTFPPFYDWAPAALLDGDDLYGMPKNVSVLSRDLSAPADPWDVDVGIAFTQGGARLDTVRGHGDARQLAVGSGVTYYARPDHSAEPPNLFAPYWRAALTRLTVDRPAPGASSRPAWDLALGQTLDGTGQREASVAFRALVRAGYAGFQ